MYIAGLLIHVQCTWHSFLFTYVHVQPIHFRILYYFKLLLYKVLGKQTKHFTYFNAEWCMNVTYLLMYVQYICLTGWSKHAHTNDSKLLYGLYDKIKVAMISNLQNRSLMITNDHSHSFQSLTIHFIEI